MTRLGRSARAGSLFLALAAAACAEHDTPLAPAPPEPAGIELTRLACTASVGQRTVTCASPTPSSGDARGIIVGGQGVYVQLTSSAVSYDAGTQRFQFDLTVQNLIPQPLGTTNGIDPDGAGVRIFFTGAPTATSGSGTITVANADGQGAFTGTGQDYFQYSGALLGGDGILSKNETSGAKTWQLGVPSTVGTFSFQLYVSAAVPYPNGYVDVTPSADSLLRGKVDTLTATVRTAVGNPVPGATVTWATNDGAVATVTPTADGSGRVVAVSTGSATITATSGIRTGSATLSVCPSLAVGEVDRMIHLPADSGFCLGGGARGAEFTVVAVNTDAGPVPLSLTGSGIVPVSGGPSPNRLAPGPRLSRAGFGASRLRRDDGFGLRLRERARRELAGKPARAGGGPRFYRAGPGGVRRAIVPGVPAVGALMSLNVETGNACSTFDTRTGRVQVVGAHVIVVADTMNPAGGLSAADYQAVADTFDALIHPTLLSNFGAPSDIDGNGRVIAFYTRAVNELTPPGSSAYTGGFFFSRDLYDATVCPTSNVGEILYMLAADPAGTVNGNARSASFVMNQTYATLGHEGEHLVNASRRIHVNTPWNGVLEEPWLDEGLAHATEEMLFWAGAYFQTLNDLDAGEFDGSDIYETATEERFFRYAEPNFGRLREWLLAPHASGPFEADDDDLATRGAIWAFLRFAADRTWPHGYTCGGACPSPDNNDSLFWKPLVNTQKTGLANLQDVLGADPRAWFRDFSIAMYADDMPGGGAGGSSYYWELSWNFRSLYTVLDYDPGPACSCAYPLAVRDPADGVAESFTLAGGGGSAYVRIGVAASGFAGVAVQSGGVGVPSTVQLAVIRRK